MKTLENGRNGFGTENEKATCTATNGINGLPLGIRFSVQVPMTMKQKTLNQTISTHLYSYLIYEGRGGAIARKIISVTPTYSG